MKKIFIFLIFSGVMLNFPCENSLAQGNAKKNNSKPWSADNPFKTDVFVENLGQFDNWAKTSAPVKYAVNSSDKIFFTKQGLTIKLIKTEILSEEERERMERKEGKEAVPEMEIYYVNMQWENCNKNPALAVSEKSEGYYTFGEKGYENVKAKGYRKLIYKELYPGIDAEYVIPHEGGIKYSLIVHPGADVSKVKMKYTGDVDKIEISDEGNLLVKTPAGDITDHAPKTFFESDHQSIPSSFSVKDDIVSFIAIPSTIPKGTPSEQPHQPSTIIIDPWTTTPTNLIGNNNAAYDIDYDYSGNVYVSGGAQYYKTAKYSNAGTLLWTFTNPAGWAMNQFYSKFCVLPQSGTVFISEGCGGARVMKLSTNGTLQFTSAIFSGTNEIWRMFYNACTKQLIGFGGGLFSVDNLQLFADTNLTNGTSLNFNGYGTYPPNKANDITSVAMDNNGDFFSITVSQPANLPVVDNRLMKSLFSSGYNPPPAFNVASGYSFEEGPNYNIIGFGAQNSVRANVLSVNSSYLFGYDGKTLIAWNKTTGAVLGSVIVNGAYTAGSYRSHEGIDVDECNNVYVGGTNQVHVYSFNGTTFTAAAPLTSNITSEVYDVCLGPMNKLYVCGVGFVTELQLTTAICSQINLTSTVTSSSCGSSSGSATITATGGTSPYTYLWNPTGQTTSTATGLSPGTYTVTVSDSSSSCNNFNGNTQTATVTITSSGSFSVTGTPTSISCNGGSDGTAAATASGGTSPYTYVWNPSAVTGAPATGLSAGTYTVIVTDATGCTGTQTVTVTQPPVITTTTSATSASCGGNNGSATVTASGGTGVFTYSWNPSGQTSQTASNLISGNYSVTVTDVNGCTTSNTVSVAPTGSITAIATNATICSGQSATLSASGGTNYSWNNGNTNATINVSPVSTSTYSVIVSAGSCVDTASATVVVTTGPTATAWNNVTITAGNSATLAASGGGTYSWSNGSSGSNISVSPTVITGYCVTVSNGNCTDSACVTVYIAPIEPMDCSAAATGELYLPNAFSPNNDGENDILNMYFGNMQCIREFEIHIYNRWGEVVYETTSTVVEWDGTYKGKMEMSAVFVYYMKATLISGEEIVKKGNISLIR